MKKLNISNAYKRIYSQNTTSYQDKKDNIFIQENSLKKFQITKKSIESYLNENKFLLCSTNSLSNFKIVSIQKDTLGYTKIKAVQTINNIPIRGSELIMHLNEDGTIKNIIGAINKCFKPYNKTIQKNITQDEAIDIAKKQFNYTNLQKRPEIIEQFIIKNELPILIYSVNIYYTEPEAGNWDVLINSSTGKVIANIDNIKYGLS
ncbi:PepSY domain-containing protein [Clostridium sp. JS66]|uniref:PepSY domain-containing protein n=1 Tax=Clostridium sp. JS66 TaxID=3064705 RepID=UPI00298D6DBE|nr:PepSY domain-containing protein [Clostridium sp. JS66]WPC43456.1 PepSY domain-containing protein [Clostridium sp. JS66]